jgi:hypothetical protein
MSRRALSDFRPVLTFLLAVSGAEIAGAQGALSLVHDFATGEPVESLPVRDVHRVGDRLVFLATDREHTERLWVSNGTLETTRPLTDPSRRTYQYSVFAAGLRDRFLWVSSAGRTQTQTVLWVNLSTGRDQRLVDRVRIPGDGPLGPAVIAGRYYFLRCTPGCAPWASDGTVTGTVAVGDLGPIDSFAPFAGPWLDRYLVLRWTNGVALHDTVRGTTRRLLTVAPNQVAFHSAGGVLYLKTFRADGRTSRSELWRLTDPEATLERVAASERAFDVLGAREDRLYFEEAKDPSGEEARLWAVNATSVRRYRGQIPFSPSVGRLGSAGAIGVLPARGDYDLGFYRVDDQRREVREIHHYCSGKYPCLAVRFSRPVDFDGQTWGTADGRLYRSDGESLVFALPHLSVDGDRLCEIGGRLVFGALELQGPNAGAERLWESDGTLAGTRPISIGSVEAPFRVVGPAVELAGALYVAASHGPSGHQLWRIDATGTHAVTELAHQAQGVNATWTGEARDGAFVIGDGFWFVDRSIGSAQRLEPAAVNCFGERPCALDPVPLDTERVRWAYSGDPAETHGLSVTDGSVAGTRTLRPTTTDSACAAGLDEEGRLPLFALASNPAGAIVVAANALWVSNGTDEGTQCLAATPGPAFAIRTVGNLTYVFFDTFDTEPPQARTQEIWRTDGTTAGTFRLAKVPFVSFVHPEPSIQAVDDHLYFLVLGTIWSSDGSAAGTRALDPAPDAPVRSLAAGEHVVYAATQSEIGAASTLWAREPATGHWNVIGTWGRLVSGPLPMGIADGDSLSFLVDEPQQVDGVFFDRRRLWRTGGTAGSTARVESVRQVERLLFSDAGVLSLSACQRNTGCELWSVDTEGDARLEREFWRGPQDSRPDLVGSGPSAMFLSITDPEIGNEVWRFDREPGSR